jgi:hypothetical protein
MRQLSILLILCLLSPSGSLGLCSDITGLRIVAVQGVGMKHRTGASLSPSPVVVRIENGDQPVQGARVSFTAPKRGPGGAFGKRKTITVTSDHQGQAAAAGFRPNDEPGTFELQVRAEHQGETASAQIPQTNELSPDTHRKRERGKMAAIFVLAIGVGSLIGTLRMMRAVNQTAGSR